MRHILVAVVAILAVVANITKYQYIYRYSNERHTSSSGGNGGDSGEYN